MDSCDSPKLANKHIDEESPYLSAGSILCGDLY